MFVYVSMDDFMPCFHLCLRKLLLEVKTGELNKITV